MIVDSHCHLDYPDFAQEVDAVVARAAETGVGRMVSISTHVRRFSRYAALAERFETVFCTVGTHPHHAAEESDIETAEIIKLSSHPRCIGIGESGLDYHYDKSPRDVQARVFHSHIAAAQKTELPLVIHARAADEDMAHTLETEMRRKPFKAVLHCFSSGAELARIGVALGLFVSFSGILTFKKSDALREIARTVPLDRLLVETDAPFLSPQNWRGQRNEPAYVRQTLEVLAQVKGVSTEEMAKITTHNFYTLFSKAAHVDGLLERAAS